MSVIHGDCIHVMAAMDPESVDAIVTDPPYNLVSIGKRFGKPDSAPVKDDNFGGRYTRLARGFMGKEWDGDGIAFRPDVWEAAYRVAKPSAYLLAFGGTRTVHRMTVALEDAGWIIRDMLVWAYASGFPKSKASLKPAWEPIVMARKPGPLRMLAIDECRIPGEMNPADYDDTRRTSPKFSGVFTEAHMRRSEPAEAPSGRWPANVILTDPIFDGGVEGVVGGGEASPGTAAGVKGSSGFANGYDGEYIVPYGDSGTYSRFFLVPKSSRSDREPVITPEGHDKTKRFSTHPTQKPTELMRHLIRLVTPTGGVVLDPFLGSGTTAIAAEREGFQWIGIEREAEYVAIAEARLNGTQRGLGLDTPAPTPRMPNTHPDLSKHQPKQRAPGENWSGRWAGTPPAEETA